MIMVLGKKIKMSQIWQDEKVIPVTLVKVEPNAITILRNKERDGYQAVQIFDGKHKREFKVDDLSQYQIGDKIDLSVFKEGDFVKVSSLSKGRGFQGVVKRHGFGGGPKTHGQKNRYRAPGSIGSTAPQRITPGRKMAGHMGNERVTIKNLKVVGVDKEKNILMLKGGVAGARGAFVEIKK